MAIISYADAYKKHLEEQKNADKKDIGLTRKYSLESGSDPGADIILGTLFMNPAKIARGVASATGKETSEGAKKALGWASMPGAKIEQGFFGAAEGITDFLAGGATQIAGQKDAAKWIYDHSWSRDAVGSDVTDEYIGDAAESKGYRLASDLISGVGNVGFQIAVGTLIGGALAAPAEVGTISKAGAKAIQYAPLFLSASGSGTAENMQKTGNLGWRENVGGLLKGGVEVLTEIASPTGRIANAALFGKSAKGMSRYLVKHAIAKNIIVNFAEEAGEEAASYIGDYFIEKWLKISDDKFSWGDLGYQAVLGGITGALFSSPSDISFVRQARKAGAKVYAQGDAAVKNKINEGLIEVKLLKERGLNNDNVKLAEAALAKLTTDENLSQTTKEYYLGLAEQMVLKQNLSDQYTALAKELVAKAKSDPATAQSMADAFNAMVNEAGGKGKYTAADFTSENSEAARIYVVAQMANDWLSRSDAEIATDEIMQRKAALYQGTAEQKTAIRSMEDGSTVAFRVGSNAYAVVTKRAGTDTYSVGFTTPGQVERDGTVYATHKLSADKVEELLSKPMTEQQIDAGIVENLAKKAPAEVEKEQKAEKKQAKAETKKKPAAKTEAKTEEAAKKKAETESKGKKKTPVQAKNAGEKASLSPATAETEQTATEKTEQTAKTEAKEKVAPEDLSTVEKRLASAFGIDSSEFTKEEWEKARECVPNIDGLTRREQARVLTLVRTAQANGINEDYMKGLARLSSVYGFGVVFEDIDVAGFYSRKNGMVVINPKNLDETFGHEIEHSFDQIVKEGKAEFRTDLSERVKRIVGASVFDRAKAQYKADYEKLRARDGSVAEMSDAELEAEATANVVGKYLSNMTLLKKIAATDYSLGRGLLAAIRRMKDKWTSAKAFAKENDSTAFAEYRKMTRIERMLMDELNKRKIPVYPIGDFDVSYSVSEWERMKENHAKYLSKKGIKVDLDAAHTMIDTVVEEMRKYAEILPQDRIGKTLVGKASYGLSVENTTICPRTLSYNEFTDKVQAKLGRPMTQMESFLASQMLYEIATDPQCLYCYVALDRKAYNEYLLRYFERRDAVIKEYREMTDKSDEAVFGKIKRDKNGNPVIGKRGHQLREGGLYAKFLGDSIDTENMEIRFRNWIGLADSGETLLTPEDVATEERKARLKNDPTSALGEQFADAHAYAQGASQAKVQHDYVAYFDDILKLSDRTVRKLNKHYGLRWYSFSDYSGAFIAENMQQVTDAAVRGLKGLAYTKDTDFAAIFAPTGMGINISVFVTQDENGNFAVDEKQSAKLDEAIKLRNKYKNVGIVVTAATDDAVVWAMQQEWSDVVIPFHIVRTGQEVAEFYKWMNYTHESGDTVRDQELWDSYQRMVGSKRASKLIYPSEHNNDYETYMRLCAERGLKPRFERFSKMDGITPEQYMKLVNETRLSASETSPLKAEFDLDAAKASFQKFVDKGGYWGSWYKDDADVEAAAERVAQDVRAGKKANEVEYGRQDKFNPKEIMRARKKVRQHGAGVTPNTSLSPAPSGSGRIVIQASQSRPTGREKLTNLKGELSRSNFRAALESLQVIAVNAQQGVENQLVRAGMTKREAAAFSQLARSGRSHAINAICYKLADMTGAIRSEGLIPILEPFLATKGEVYDAVDKDGNTVQSTAKGGELAGKRYSDFSDYYAMLHAIDREAVGKNPYSSMTVAQMKQIVAEYEQKNPDFKAAAEKLSAYNSAMLDIEVQAGIISQETADLWRKQYPHYVPMYTQDSNAVGGKPVRGSRNMEVRRDNKAATESDHRVSDPLRNYIDQVQRRIRAAKLNILLNEVYNSADGVNVVTAEADRAEAKDLRAREQAYLENPESENDPAEMFRKFKRGKNTVNEVSFYKDGKRVTMAVTDRIYTGLSDLGGIHSSILDSWTVKAVKKVNDTFKKLVTNWNPFFAVKNIARDLQDGLLNSKFGMGEFLNMYRKNVEMMTTGKYSKEWELFIANGCLEASIFSDEFNTLAKSGKSGLEQATGVVGQFQHIKNFNTLTEALPRFTEFCLTLKHGGTIQQAIYNAADVTVNFSRSGVLTRILNKTVSPFLNPAVQGLDRVIRLFTEDGIKNNKALASLLLKAVLLAIVPMALGNAMYGDDDEYKDMKDSIKENNYLFKVGDTWLKLPRGRVVSTISGLFNRSYKQLTGQETDWGDYGKNVLDQITPAQNVARHIGSPFYDVANNRTWYGTKIESDALQNYAVNQRYDENTSRISVWIGQLTSHFGLSPKEVNYLIDQYTGVVGDILLPTTTPAGTKGVVSYNFTVDPNTSSNLSNRFYDLYNRTMYKTNDGDVEAYYLKKRLDETKSAVSELFKQIKTINASSELSNKEKVKQASAIRASINQLYKTALDDRRLYEQNIKDALAIENSYAVEKITAQSAKRYGLDSDAVGKYALTFGGDFVKQYDTEAQANDYKADTSKKTVYAEANRLTYGAEYALKEYNANVYEKASKLNELGISYDEYYNYYMTARYYSGKTKKDKILAYLNGSGLSKSQIALMMYYSGYSAYADEAKKAIKASSLSAERKKELLAGFTN